MKLSIFLLSFFFSELFAVDLQNDLEVIYERRLVEIVTGNHNITLANQWQNEITGDGIWSDVDYTAGCPARRATWPAQHHWHRIITMASVWYRDQEHKTLLNKTLLALNWWFDRDFTEPDCINGGGQNHLNCPCGTPGMWNTNWYGQMILIPGLVGNACLVIRSILTTEQTQICRTIISRAYDRIDGDPNGSMGAMTGANMLDVASRGINLAILANDTDILSDAIYRYFNECQYTSGTNDGIKVDGSFMQHSSQIYNGNYGADFMRTMLLLFAQTLNTSFVPPESVQTAYLTVINGSEWFVYRKTKGDDPYSPLLSWQYSVMGRMISFKYSDWRGINLNFDNILPATETWDNHANFQEIVGRLNSGNNVNPGGLVGTRYFPASDYMVHRGPDYIVSLKMFSTRTTNSECNNDQNPFGFHLSDGVIYTYRSGHEYTDIYGAWDWYLTPGSTVDYGVTPLSCSRVQFKGKESYVGGVSLGNAGVAVMNYTNPMSESLRWLKSYFFFPNSYVVQFIGDVRSTSDSAPIYTTLDQRQLSGPVYIDGVLLTETRVNLMVRQVWHDRIGYEFLHQVNLTIDISERQANWAAIGISEGNETHSIFAAYFTYSREQGTDERFTYITYIDVDLKTFSLGTKQFSSIKLYQKKNSSGRRPPADVRLVTYGDSNGTTTERYISIVFLTAGFYSTQLKDITGVNVDAPILLQFQRKAENQGWQLAASDPGRNLTTVEITVNLSYNPNPVVVNIDLPTGNWAGGSTIVEFA